LTEVRSRGEKAFDSRAFEDHDGRVYQVTGFLIKINDPFMSLSPLENTWKHSLRRWSIFSLSEASVLCMQEDFVPLFGMKHSITATDYHSPLGRIPQEVLNDRGHKL
jgi:hypothetical protein